MEKIKVSVKDGKPCEKVLSVDIPHEEIQKEYDLFYRSVAPNAKIPGFRPGKAPRQVLEMHFQGEARERVLQALISESFRKALQDTSLAPIIHPKIEVVDFNDQKLSYKAHIEVRPKIKLSRVKGLAAKKEKIEVKPEEVHEALNRIQESLAQFRAVEDRPAQMGDFVIADYVCKVDGREIEKRTEEWFELKEDEFLKGFSANLVGIRPGESKEIQIQFPETAARKELSRKPAFFQVNVKEIKSKELPPLTDDLAKEAGEYKTLEALKAKLEQDILAEKEKTQEVAFENALLEDLLKHNPVTLPEGLVQKRVERLLEDAKHRFLHQGGREADFEKKQKEMTADFQKEAKRQVHLAFLLDEIAVQENMTVSAEERKARHEQIAGRVRQPLAEIEKFYSENENARDSLNDQLRNERAIQFIKQYAKQK